MIAGNSHYDVLLVDDDAGDANLTRLAIGEGPLACRLHHVKDGVEALAFLRRENGPYAEAPRPDLVLLDLNMPRKNGREVLEEVKADPDLRTIPVVVMTTSDADWILRKPIGWARTVSSPNRPISISSLQPYMRWKLIGSAR